MELFKIYIEIETYWLITVRARSNSILRIKRPFHVFLYAVLRLVKIAETKNSKQQTFS